MSVEFLVKVLPWPAEGDPGYINLHWIEKGGRSGMPGWPCASPLQMYSTRDFIGKNNKPVDFYICMSLQAEALDKVSKSTGKAYKAAVRKRENVLALKSLFIDVDEKNYPDAKALLVDFERFRHETSLPFPNAIVHSGGGYHFYYALNQSITLVEWQPLANSLSNAIKQHGLQADTQCTVDAARVLRLPATLNYKYDPPKKVVVKHLSDNDFSAEFLAGKLAPYQTSAPVQVGFQGLPIAGPPVPNNLAAGIEPPKAYLVPPQDLIHECPLFAEAIQTKGANYSNPLWNLTTLLATFMENGPSLARIMAKGHKTYVEADTDALYARKEKEKADRNIGWPTCKAFSDAGSTVCKTCPNFAGNKSPLNFAKKNGVMGTVPIKQTINVPGYVYENGRFFRIGYTKDDPPQEEKTLVFRHEIRDWGIPPVASAGEVPFLQFRVPAINNYPIKVPFGALPNAFKLTEVLADQRMVLNRYERKEMELFMPLFAQQLQDSKEQVLDEVSASGWNTNRKTGDVDGFSYNGVCYGEKFNRTARLLDPALHRQYSPCGTPDAWRKLADKFIEPDRHSVNTLVAASLAGPLVEFTGCSGLILSVYSTTGKGKSTGAKLGQAIFGSPKLGVNQLKDTTNSLYDKMASLHSLTCYFDESRFDVKDRDALFQMTSGKDKSRLTNAIQQREIRSWNTLLVLISNDGTSQIIDRSAPAHMRVLEVLVEHKPTNNLSFVDIDFLAGELENNYGHRGATYAKFLAKNIKRIKNDVLTTKQRLATITSADQEERFWIAIITCLLLGAQYGNELEFTNFDIQGMESFLIDTMNNMRRQRVTETINVNSFDSIHDLLTEYIKARRPTTARMGVDQNAKPIMLNSPEFNAKGVALNVQIGTVDKVLRVSESDFRRYCSMEKHSYKNLHDGFVRELGMTKVNGARIGGAGHKNAVERLWHFDMSKWPADKVFD